MLVWCLCACVWFFCLELRVCLCVVYCAVLYDLLSFVCLCLCACFCFECLCGLVVMYCVRCVVVFCFSCFCVCVLLFNVFVCAVRGLVCGVVWFVVVRFVVFVCVFP